MGREKPLRFCESPRAKLRCNDTKQSIKHFIYNRGKHRKHWQGGFLSEIPKREKKKKRRKKEGGRGKKSLTTLGSQDDDEDRCGNSQARARLFAGLSFVTQPPPSVTSLGVLRGTCSRKFVIFCAGQWGGRGREGLSGHLKPFLQMNFT